MSITAEGLTKLADTAFTGRNNLSARGALIKAIGEENTRDIGLRYGVTDIMSLKEKGTKPQALELDVYLSEAVAFEHDAVAAAKKEQLYGKPLHPSVSTSETNGWSRSPRNIVVGEDGIERWSERALKLQEQTTKLGMRAAMGVAHSAGSSVGAPYPPKARDAQGRFKGA
jgi:hypothetical protein